MKFTVHLMTAYCSWEGIEAESETEAIAKTSYPPEFDCNDPHTFVALEEEGGMGGPEGIRMDCLDKGCEDDDENYCEDDDECRDLGLGDFEISPKYCEIIKGRLSQKYLIYYQ